MVQLFAMSLGWTETFSGSVKHPDFPETFTGLFRWYKAAWCSLKKPVC